MQFQEEQDYTKRFDAGIWVHLLKYAKPFYKHLFVVAAMMLVCAGMDVVFPIVNRRGLGIVDGTREEMETVLSVIDEIRASSV